MTKRRVLILGGGFAGFNVARTLEDELSGRARRETEVVLIARSDGSTFSPMLPSVSAATLAPESVAPSLHALLGRTTVVVAEVESVDPEARRVRLREPAAELGDTRDVPYDELVLALGTEPAYHDTPGAARYGLPLKTEADGAAIRARVERALDGLDEGAAARPGASTVAVVGVGYAGCEIASELMDSLRERAAAYPSPRRPEVVIFGLEDECMPEVGPGLGRYARECLIEAGVDVRLGVRVVRVSDEGVFVDGGEGETLVPAGVVVWAAGVTTAACVKALSEPGFDGRVPVASTFRSPTHEGLWALGDCAAVPDTKGGRFCAQTAQHAVRQGRALARNLLRRIDGKPLRPYRYRPVGFMASLGKRKAVVRFLGISLRGRPAFYLRRAYYLTTMPGLGTKARVLLDWFAPERIAVADDAHEARVPPFSGRAPSSNGPGGAATSPSDGRSEPRGPRLVNGTGARPRVVATR